MQYVLPGDMAAAHAARIFTLSPMVETPRHLNSVSVNDSTSFGVTC